MEKKRRPGRPRVAEKVLTTPVYLTKSEIAVLRKRFGTISKAIRATVLAPSEIAVNTPINVVQASHKPAIAQRYTIRPVVDPYTNEPDVQVLPDDLGEWVKCSEINR